MCKLFADDCKLYKKNIKSEADLKELQEDIYRLCQWSKEWLLGFNFTKSNIVSYGNCQFEHEYYMIDDKKYHKLSYEDFECDLGIFF